MKYIFAILSIGLVLTGCPKQPAVVQHDATVDVAVDAAVDSAVDADSAVSDQ